MERTDAHVQGESEFTLSLEFGASHQTFLIPREYMQSVKSCMVSRIKFVPRIQYIYVFLLAIRSHPCRFSKFIQYFVKLRNQIYQYSPLSSSQKIQIGPYALNGVHIQSLKLL